MSYWNPAIEPCASASPSDIRLTFSERVATIVIAELACV